MAAENPPQTDQGKALLQQLTAEEQQQVITNAAETFNLAQSMDEGLQKDIAQEVYKGYGDDNDTRTEWLDQHTFWLSLYMQQDYAENSDSERSWGATESIPILAEACDQFQTRTYKAMFPNDSFVSAVPMRRTPNDEVSLEERAERIGHHMSYQLGFEDRNFKQDKDALFLGVAVHGSFFTKTYFNDRKRRFQVDNIRPTDLVVNYNVGPTRIEDLRRKTHIRYSTIGETEDWVRQGFFSQPAMAAQYEDKSPYNVKVDETQGLAPNSYTSIKRDAPAVLLEQHLYLDLDDTGIYKPYIATICAASRRLLRLTVGYECDPVGNPTKDFEQTQYFTHYKFKENPDGFYGLGLGHSIGDLNSAANIMLRQIMDAGTLANDGNMSGFISERLGLEGDEIRMVLGKLNKIPDTIGDFQNSIMMMKFPGPNAALIEIMQAIDERAQRLGSTTEATTGTPSRQEVATTYLAEIEQAMETFSSVQMRLSNSFSEELQKIYRINQKYLPLVSYYVVNNTPEAITRGDYVDDMLIQPVFDPKFATHQQKIARAQAELQATMENPNNQMRPQVYDVAFGRYLKALDVDNIEELLPGAAPPQEIDDQNVENMQFLMPPQARQPFDVFPQQNHMQHLTQLEQFVAEKGATLDPEQQQAVIMHKMKHEAYQYGIEKGIIQPQQGGNPAMAAGQSDQMGNSSIGQAIPAAPSFPPAQNAGTGMG